MKVLIFFVLCGYISTNACISKQQTTETWNKVKKEFDDIGNEISDGFNKAKKEIVNTYNDVEPKIEKGFDVAGKGVVDGFKKAETAVEDEWDKIKKVFLDACKCINYDCGCCVHLEEPEIHLNSTICTNITYLVKDYELADVCVRLYDINATSSYLHLCVMIEARMRTILIAKYDLGCINFGPPRLSMVTTENGPFVELEESEDGLEKETITNNWAIPVLTSSLTILLIIIITITVCLIIKKARKLN
ncbi:hypothetical protein C0J52_24826 [Blattella germanica]|nr:hypothetical protein C0J52_24826 [Blattella germanica]